MGSAKMLVLTLPPCPYIMHVWTTLFNYVHSFSKFKHSFSPSQRAICKFQLNVINAFSRLFNTSKSYEQVHTQPINVFNPNHALLQINQLNPKLFSWSIKNNGFHLLSLSIHQSNVQSKYLSLFFNQSVFTSKQNIFTQTLPPMHYSHHSISP